eukprot:s1428_g8.t1
MTEETLVDAAERASSLGGATSLAPSPSPMTSPEPAEEPGADGGALHAGQDQRSDGHGGSEEQHQDVELPTTEQDGRWQEESSSNMSRVTDQVVEPAEDEMESPEYVSYEGETLDTNVGTKIWLVRTESSWPRYALTDRRQAFCIFPKEESRIVNDKWPININRRLEKPWHGNITFYESKEPYDPYALFGQVVNARRPPGSRNAPSSPPGPPGSGDASSSSRPAGSDGNTQRGGTGGSSTHQHGGPTESPQQNNAAQLALEFKMDATDDDGQWHDIHDMCVNDVHDDRMVRHVKTALEFQGRGEGTKVVDFAVLMAPKKNQSSTAASSIQSSIYAMMNEEDKDDKTSKRMGAKRCEKAWNRLVMALVLLMQTTRQQMVLDYMQKKGMEHDAEDTENVGEKYKKATRAKGKVNRVQTPSRVPTMQGKPVRSLVGLPDMRITMGEVRETDHAASLTKTVIPETPDSQSVQTVTGTYPQFLPAPRSKPEQGAVTLHQGQDRYGSWRTSETARARSLSKDCQMTGLRVSQAAKRVPHFHLDREGTLENVEDPLEQAEMLMISDVEKEEWSDDEEFLPGPPHVD